MGEHSANAVPAILSGVLENGIFGNVLVRGNSGKDRVQSTDSEGRVRRNCNAVGRWLLGLNDDVTANLMDFLVFPAFAEMLDQCFSAQIAGESHATASTSSRVR